MSSAGGYKKKKRTAEGRQGASTCGKSKPSTGRRALALQGRLCAQQLLEAKTCGTFSKRQNAATKDTKARETWHSPKKAKLTPHYFLPGSTFPPSNRGCSSDGHSIMPICASRLTDRHYISGNRHYIHRTPPHWFIPSAPNDFTGIISATGNIRGFLLFTGDHS